MLNQDLSFSGAPIDVKNAFLGSPEKVFIPVGTRLYKWTGFPLVGEGGRITPWWSFVEQRHLGNGIVADGLRRSAELADRLKTSPRNYQRVRAAVSENFNTMNDLLIVELLQDVWAFAGRAMGQPEFADPKLNHVFLIGGSCQLWLPNLTGSHVRKVA